MKILPVRKRLAKPLAGVTTCAGRRENYRFRPADVFVRLFLPSRIFIINDNFAKLILRLRRCKGAVPKVMSATLNVVVSINSTTVMQTYWTASYISILSQSWELLALRFCTNCCLNFIRKLGLFKWCI